MIDTSLGCLHLGGHSEPPTRRVDTGTGPDASTVRVWRPQAGIARLAGSELRPLRESARPRCLGIDDDPGKQVNKQRVVRALPRGLLASRGVPAGGQLTRKESRCPSCPV